MGLGGMRAAPRLWSTCYDASPPYRAIRAPDPGRAAGRMVEPAGCGFAVSPGAPVETVIPGEPARGDRARPQHPLDPYPLVPIPLLPLDRRGPSPRACLRCRYSLAGLDSDVCPECGCSQEQERARAARIAGALMAEHYDTRDEVTPRVQEAGDSAR